MSVPAYRCAACGAELWVQWREGNGYRCRRCGGFTPNAALGLPEAGPAPRTTPLDGTWVSPGYRSGHLRATVACLTLGLATGSIVIIAILTLGILGLLDDAGGGSLTGAGASGYVEVVAAWELVNAVAVLLAGVAFLAWQSRSIANVPWLGGGTPAISPGWSIAWWLIPFADLFMPYRSMADLERRTAAGIPRTRLMAAWWVLFVGCNVVDRLLSLAMAETASVDEARSLVIVDVLALIGIAVSGVLGIVVVRGIQRASEARAAALGLPDGVPLGGPSWGAQPRVPGGAELAAGGIAAAGDAAAAGGEEPMAAPDTAAGPGAVAVGSEPAGSAPIAGGSPIVGGSVPVRPDLLECPSCGRRRASAFRYCVACRFDFTRTG